MSNTSLLGSYGAQDSSSLMFRNVLINGNFDVWQRGTTGTNTGTFLGSYVSADRWKFLTHTSSVGWVDGTLTQTTDTPSADIKYGVKVVSTSASLDDVVVFQTVEAINAQSLVGKSATLSFWYKKGAGLAAAKTFKYAVRYLNTADVGTNAPLSMDLTTLIQEATISSSSMSSAWAKITMTIPVMPSQAANGVVVEFRLDDDNFGSGDLLFLAQVQLEAGPTATPFERRPYSVELGMCQRYFEVVPLLPVYGDTWSLSAFMVQYRYSVVKRDTPSLGWANLAYYNSGAVPTAYGATVGTVQASSSGFSIYPTGLSGSKGWALGTAYASAEL